MLPAATTEPVANIFVGKVDPLAFLTLLKTKIDVLVAEIDDAAKKQAGYMGRR